MKSNEKRLLLIVLVIGILGGVFIGWDFFSKKESILTAEKGRIETELVRIDALFEEREIWNARSAWLNSKLPSYESIGQIEQDIFKTAAASGVEGIVSTPHSPLPGLETAHYTQAGIALTVEGKHEDIFRWLYDLKKPENFHVVRNLKVLLHKKEPEKIVCQFELLRWYAPKTQK